MPPKLVVLRLATACAGGLLIGLALMTLGCQRDTPAPNAGGANQSAGPGTPSGAANGTARAEAEQPAKPDDASPPAGGTAKAQPKPSPAAVDDEVRKPATVEEAVAVLDLRELPLLPGSSEDIDRNIVHLMHQAPGTCRAAFEFYLQELQRRGWKELGEPSVSESSCTAILTKQGFRLSLSTSPGSEPDQASVMLWNHGNVNLARLPVPPGAKERYSQPTAVDYVTDAGLEETTAAVRALLLAAGWQPYGGAGDVMGFKQNAISLQAWVSAARAEHGKTTINYACNLLAADLPAPPDATRVDFDDSLKRLYVEAPGAAAQIVAFYRSALEPAGWQATTDKPIVDGGQQFLVFRNPAKDMLTLTIYRAQPGSRIMLTHRTAAEVAEEDRRIKDEQAELRRKEEEIANRPKPAANVTVPEGALAVEESGGRLEFKIGAGGGQVAAQAIVAELEDAGWEIEESESKRIHGDYKLKKGELSVRVYYIDPGPIPAAITVSGYGLEVKPAAAKPE